MPETVIVGELAAEAFGGGAALEFGASAAALGGGAAAVGGGLTAAEVAGGLGELGAADGFGGGAAAGFGVDGGSFAGSAGAFGGYSPGLDYSTLLGNGGGGGGSFGANAGGNLLQSLGSEGGMDIFKLLGKGGKGLGVVQLLSSLYGLNQSRKMSDMAMRPNLMGEQAVQRSMAAQGYQGSGNMMAALSQYGINGSLAASQAGRTPLASQLGYLGLGTSALPKIFGDGNG